MFTIWQPFCDKKLNAVDLETIRTVGIIMLNMVSHANFDCFFCFCFFLLNFKFFNTIHKHAKKKVDVFIFPLKIWLSYSKLSRSKKNKKVAVKNYFSKLSCDALSSFLSVRFFYDLYSILRVKAARKICVPTSSKAQTLF